MTSLSYSHQPSVKALAREGNFRAIAYWLNSQLVPKGIYVHIQAAKPGCLRTLVEFQRLPDRDRLVRFICHRLWQLESELIEGVVIVARYVGESRPLWQQAVRIPTLSERRIRTGGAIPISKARSHPNPLPPQIRAARKAPKWLSPTISSPQQLKLVRAFFLSGSAIAAFLIGCWLDVITAQSGPMLPVISQHPEPEPATPIWQPTVQRPHTVSAALETVGVIEHEDLPNPHDPTITLVFGGDVSPESLNISTADTGSSSPLAAIEDYQQADVALVSLNASLASAATSLEEEYYNRRRPDSAEILRQSGVDIVTLTNDQLTPYGEEGVTETLETLDRAGIYRMGAGRDLRERRRPEILDVKGQRIAYLGYVGTDEDTADGSAISLSQLQTVAEDIRAIRDQVDWIVVNYRWNKELTETVEDWQTELARFAIDQGADLVVGHHPQTLQGAEVYKDRPIAYSLGDFFAMKDVDGNYDTAVLKVSLRAQQMKVEFLPVAVQEAQPRIAEGDRGFRILQTLEQASKGFEKPMQSPMILDTRLLPEIPVDPDAPFIETSGPESILENESLPLPEAEPEPTNAEIDALKRDKPKLDESSEDLKFKLDESDEVKPKDEDAAPQEIELEKPKDQDQQIELEFDQDKREYADPELDQSVNTETEDTPALPPPESDLPAPSIPIEPYKPSADEKAKPEPPAVIKPVEEPLVGPLAQQDGTPVQFSLEIAKGLEPIRLEPQIAHPTDDRATPVASEMERPDTNTATANPESALTEPKIPQATPPAQPTVKPAAKRTTVPQQSADTAADANSPTQKLSSPSADAIADPAPPESQTPSPSLPPTSP